MPATDERVQAPATLRLEPGEGVVVDVPRLLASRLLVQASSGGGKSWMLRYVVEQLAERLPVWVLDYEGEYPSLRERYPFLLAGDGGEVAIDVKTAGTLARRLLELQVSAVIDLSGLRLNERRAYVGAFLEATMSAPRRLWGARAIVVDEAQALAPQEGSSAATEVMGALALQGRKRGFAGIMATARLSKLDKDVSASLLNRLIGLTGEDVDQRRAADALGFDREGARSLGQLDPGEFWAYGPAIAKTPVLVRAGGIRTHHPQPGEIAPPVPPAKGAIKALAAELEDLATRAAAEVHSIEEAEARIRELEREVQRLRKGHPPAVDGAALRELRARAEAAEARAQAAEEDVRTAAGIFAQTATEVAQLGEAIAARGRLLLLEDSAAPPASAPRTLEEMGGLSFDPAAAARARSEAPSSRPQRDASDAVQRILDGLATYEALGQLETPRPAAAAMAGYKQGGYFNTAVRQAVDAGLLTAGAGSLALTPAGRARAHARPVHSLADVHAVWLAQGDDAQRRVLQVLLERYPTPVPRDELAAAAGYRVGGYFNTAPKALETMGAAEKQGKRLVASRLLYPEGLS